MVRFYCRRKGCKCVKEEPWVTVAESSELVLALVRIGLLSEAEKLLDSLHQWRDNDELYWTAYVYPDDKFWPIEKPTWTAGAVLLAADAVGCLMPLLLLSCLLPDRFCLFSAVFSLLS